MISVYSVYTRPFSGGTWCGGKFVRAVSPLKAAQVFVTHKGNWEGSILVCGTTSAREFTRFGNHPLESGDEYAPE